MSDYPVQGTPSRFAQQCERVRARAFGNLPETRLRRGIRNNNLDLVRRLVERGDFRINDPLRTRVSLNKLRPQTDFTLLHEAAQEGSFEMVELLLWLGAEPSAKTSWNISPMHLAAIEGRAHVVALLASRGASVLDQFPCLSTYAEEDPYTPTSLQLLASAGVKEFVGDEHVRYRAKRDATHLEEYTTAPAGPGASRPRL